jgi:hypothetical protein
VTAATARTTILGWRRRGRSRRFVDAGASDAVPRRRERRKVEMAAEPSSVVGERALHEPSLISGHPHPPEGGYVDTQTGYAQSRN